MKLVIKSLDQKTYQVELDDKKTVLDLKKHLCKVQKLDITPNQQQIIYSGCVLNDDAVLKKHCIDERKFLVVMKKRSLSPRPTKVTAKEPSQKSSKKPKLRTKSDSTCEESKLLVEKPKAKNLQNKVEQKERPEKARSGTKDKYALKEEHENKEKIKTKNNNNQNQHQIRSEIQIGNSNANGNESKTSNTPLNTSRCSTSPHMPHKHCHKRVRDLFLSVTEKQRSKRTTPNKTAEQKSRFWTSTKSTMERQTDARKEKAKPTAVASDPPVCPRAPHNLPKVRLTRSTPMIYKSCRRSPKHKHWLHELAQDYAADVFAAQVAMDAHQANLDQQPPMAGCCQKFLQQLVSMGYDETDACRALISSFNNPDRAIAYLIENTRPPDGVEGTTSSRAMRTNGHFYNPLSYLRHLPSFKHLRFLIQERPDLLDKILSKIGSVYQPLFEMIKENKEEFLDLINDRSTSNVQPHSNENLEVFQEYRTTVNDHKAIERLAMLGCGRLIALQTYMACDKNEELAAECLCRYLND